MSPSPNYNSKMSPSPNYNSKMSPNYNSKMSPSPSPNTSRTDYRPPRGEDERNARRRGSRGPKLEP